MSKRTNDRAEAQRKFDSLPPFGKDIIRNNGSFNGLSAEYFRRNGVRMD